MEFYKAKLQTRLAPGDWDLRTPTLDQGKKKVAQSFTMLCHIPTIEATMEAYQATRFEEGRNQTTGQNRNIVFLVVHHGYLFKRNLGDVLYTIQKKTKVSGSFRLMC